VHTRAIAKTATNFILFKVLSLFFINLDRKKILDNNGVFKNKTAKNLKTIKLYRKIVNKIL